MDTRIKLENLMIDKGTMIYLVDGTPNGASVNAGTRRDGSVVWEAFKSGSLYPDAHGTIPCTDVRPSEGEGIAAALDALARLATPARAVLSVMESMGGVS